MNWQTKWGSDDDRRAVMHFKSRFAALGLPPDRIERILNDAAADAHLLEDPVRATEWWRDYAGRTGMSFDDATMVEAVFHGTIENGIAAPAALSAGDLERMRELEKMMGAGRYSEYWRDENLRDEYADLVLRREASGATSAAVPADSAARATRRAELEKMIREDNREYYKSGADREYRALLESDSEAVSSSATDGTALGLANGGSSVAPAPITPPDAA
jgi:hypothetical protein